MKFLIYILSVIQICNTQKIVKELVDGINEAKQQATDNVPAKNFNEYVGPGFNPDVVPYFDGDFDFIICGAGTAGSLVANRLSQNPPWNILLIDAGEDETIITDIPSMSNIFKASNFTLPLKTTKQKNGCGGFINNSIPIPQGKAIGGSSVIDDMSYVRGNKYDYNTWGIMNSGWSYDEVLPYFKKHEAAHFPNADTNFHGTTGELNVDYPPDFSELAQAFLDAFKESGGKIGDYNAADQLVASELQLFQQDGKRDSSANAFLTPIKDRTNLKIYSRTFIVELLIDEQNVVYGVLYLKDGVLHYAKAKKEVILCLGAVGTAQLLMLSGIGPKDHLNELNIPVKKDLPVGSYVWDNVAFTITFSVNTTEMILDLVTEVKQYLKGFGPLTTPSYLQAVGFANLFGNLFNIPDVEYLFHCGTKPVDSYQLLKNLDGITQETYENIVLPTLGKLQWGIHIVLLHPKSTGTIRLKSNLFTDYPEVDPNYFSEGSDLTVIVKAINDVLKIAETAAFKKYNSTVIKLSHSACAGYKWKSDAYWRCMVQNFPKPLYELSGSTKMGPANDPTAVVDNNLKVHGVGNLRVADSGVFPVTISGHSSAPTYMIGEKACDIIKKQYPA